MKARNEAIVERAQYLNGLAIQKMVEVAKDSGIYELVSAIGKISFALAEEEMELSQQLVRDGYTSPLTKRPEPQPEPVNEAHGPSEDNHMPDHQEEFVKENLSSIKE